MLLRVEEELQQHVVVLANRAIFSLLQIRGQLFRMGCVPMLLAICETSKVGGGEEGVGCG